MSEWAKGFRDGEAREAALGKSAAVLSVEDLSTQVNLRNGAFLAVDRVSFRVEHGETFGIVGESGCGKSMTALAILSLLPDVARTVGGSIDFGGVDLLTLPNHAVRRIRGNEISMVFQEPMTSLNPLKTIGDQICEVLILHKNLSRRAAMDYAAELLELVRIPEARSRLLDFPHSMSGGMRQRVMIAMAIACKPKIILADEPTTALDVTIQAQIMELLAELKEQTGTSIILITHDLGLVADQAQRIMVMYTGRKVEEAPATELFEIPCHPYTTGLLQSVPRLGVSQVQARERRRLPEIPGFVPSLLALPNGCTFADRCTFATDQCRAEAPPLEEKRPGHWAACWHSSKVMDCMS